MEEPEKIFPPLFVRPGLLRHPKKEWKHIVKQAIYNKFDKDLAIEASITSSLTYLAPKFTHGTVHRCISSVRTPGEVTRANVKLRLLTGSYKLQKHSFKFKEKSDSSCPICNAVEEDTQHFLLDCPPLEDVRGPYLRFIKELIPYVHPHRDYVIQTPRLLTQLILDSSHPMLTPWIMAPDLLEKTTRDMCYALHLRRSTLILSIRTN
jgi:hypothetical protein